MSPLIEIEAIESRMIGMAFKRGHDDSLDPSITVEDNPFSPEKQIRGHNVRIASILSSAWKAGFLFINEKEAEDPS
jgi:hypothetical protein